MAADVRKVGISYAFEIRVDFPGCSVTEDGIGFPAVKALLQSRSGREAGWQIDEIIGRRAASLLFGAARRLFHIIGIYANLNVLSLKRLMVKKLAVKHAVLWTLLLLLPLSAFSGEVRVFAAASLTDAVSEVGNLYASLHPGASVVRNFAASGTLAKQIVNGAPADIYLSANPKWMDYLQTEGKVGARNVRVLAFNELVFAGAPNPAIASMADLPRLLRIAIGSPSSVPAGRYAEKALQAAGLYEELMGTGKLVIAKDVRQALMYADRGEADGAFVYRTDALLSSRVSVLFTVPKESYPRVTYPMALTVTGAENAEAADFYRFLESRPAREVLARFGFMLQ